MPRPKLTEIRKPRRLVLCDKARSRRIPLDVFLPPRAKAGPVVILSHGSAMPAQAYFYLARHWARHGYICILPSHLGPSEKIGGISRWKIRPRDISFIIDSLDTIGRRLTGRRFGLVPIGVCGHSYGAYTTTALAGATIFSDKRAHSWEDRRVQAFLAISPEGPGQMGLKPSSWRPIAAPLMTISGTEDTCTHRLAPKGWRKEAFRKSAPGDKFHVHIEGANHFSFMDALVVRGKTWQAPDPFIQHSVASISLTFWDLYLRSRPASDTALTSARIASKFGGRISLSKR